MRYHVWAFMYGFNSVSVVCLVISLFVICWMISFRHLNIKDLIDCNIISRDDALDIIATGNLDTVSGLKDSINNYNK